MTRHEADMVRTAMAPDDRHAPPGDDRNGASDDPWPAFAYLVSGVLLYGMLGWGLDRWLGTNFLVGLGIVLGAALGIYLTWARLRAEGTPRHGRPDDETV